jgi:hypothetical protein
MKNIVTIKGKPVIEIYESFNGSYWYVTEKAWKQDSLIGRKIYKNDQILFGYVKLESCPEFGEFGYFSEAELKQLGWRIWRVRKQDWCLCPDVELEEAEDETGSPESEGRGVCVPQSPSANLCEGVART